MGTLFSDAFSLVGSDKAGSDDFLHRRKPFSQADGETTDAEDVGEKAVADDGSSDHPVLVLLASNHQTS